MPGSVIVLNGTTSAGKSTLAAELCSQLAAQGDCWIVMGLDDLFSRLPPAWIRMGGHVGRHAAEGIEFEMVDGEIVRRVGPIGRSTLAAYRGGVAAAARAGLNVIVDEVLLSEEDWAAWQVELAGITTDWVAVDCPLETVEQREMARGDRFIGMARAQHDVVHRHPAYALRVDTSTLSAGEAASSIIAALVDASR